MSSCTAVALPAGTPLAADVLASRMVALDLLRGFAVLAVVFFHGFAYSAPGFPWANPAAKLLFAVTAAGWAGVNLFFVLSGFLITGNLIDSRSMPNYYGRFYWRRVLRILPIYIFVLALLYLLHLTSFGSLLISLFFLANMPGLFGHGYTTFSTLWSLAVEEQFYLLWPWLYRRLGDRGLFRLCLALVIICPLLRALGLANILRLGDVLSKTWNIADNLAIGALLALVARSPAFSLRSFLRTGVALTAAAAVGLPLILASGHPIHGSVLGGSLGYTFVEWLAAGVMCLLLACCRNRKSPSFLRFLVFFGEISYGLYLLHQICLDLYDRWFGRAFMTDSRALLLRFVLANAAAIALATISRGFFEGPILQLRKRIPAAG